MMPQTPFKFNFNRAAPDKKAGGDEAFGTDKVAHT